MIQFLTSKDLRNKKASELFVALDADDEPKCTKFKTLCAEASSSIVVEARDVRVGYEGRTLLHNAVRSGKVQAVSFLINIGVDVNAVDSSVGLVTPVMDAICYNQIEIATILVKAGANLHMQDMRRENSFHYAARCGSTRMLSNLIRFGDLSPDIVQQLASTPNATSKFPEDIAANSLAKEVLVDLREKGCHFTSNRKLRKQ